MDFISSVVKNLENENKNNQRKVVKYNNKEHYFYVIINNIEYEIIYNIRKYSVFYSLPTNTVHPAWTKRVVKSINRPDLVKLYWSAIKPGQLVTGFINKNNKFELIK